MNHTIDAKQIKIVRSTAQKIYSSMKINKTIPLEDLYQFGFLGWIEAKNKFDSTRKVNFNTFAYYRIHGAIIDGLRKMGFFTRSGFKKYKNCYNIMSLDSWSRINRKYFEKSRFHEDNLVILTDNNEFSDHRETEILIKKMMKLIGSLPTREQTLLNEIYFKDNHLRNISQSLKLHKSWLCKLHKDTLKKLAKELES